LRRERVNHTLQPTALINEAYLKLIDQREVKWQNRAHFFALAAQARRRILVDYARVRKREKRGGTAENLPLDEALTIVSQEKKLIWSRSTKPWTSWQHLMKGRQKLSSYVISAACQLMKPPRS